ncbi:MAG TPA: sulfatase-like hydrolase/transferase [Verrucomicrobiae bacterium]|nr:sulfatase-like hydrolase/transferase [Verrucomicrobiae bacterium]
MFKRIVLIAAALSCVRLLAIAAPAHQTENVVLITLDGLRWQEVFMGMEEQLATREYGVWDTNRLRSWFWRETTEERRQALMPFLWKTIGKRGQLYGNGNKGSVSIVTNGKNFTYPGFNEIFTGSPDDRIDKNEKRYNSNVSVLEWLHRKPAFAGRVVGFANWAVHPYVLNTQRSGIPVWSGFDTNFPGEPGSRLELIQQLQKDTIQIWYEMTFDSFYFHAANEYMRDKQPRLVWLALSETDEWGHGGNYEHYLQAANNSDRYIGKLWDTVQSIAAYKDKTTFIITCDHGRGSGAEWKHHGAGVAGAEKTWLAVIGPDTRPLGERTNIAQVTHSQIAATLAALLGEDYHSAVPKSGPPIQDLLPVGTAK